MFLLACLYAYTCSAAAVKFSGLAFSSLTSTLVLTFFFPFNVSLSLSSRVNWLALTGYNVAPLSLDNLAALNIGVSAESVLYLMISSSIF